MAMRGKPYKNFILNSCCSTTAYEYVALYFDVFLKHA
jgi:hypothetical protein